MHRHFAIFSVMYANSSVSVHNTMHRSGQGWIFVQFRDFSWHLYSIYSGPCAFVTSDPHTSDPRLEDVALCGCIALLIFEKVDIHNNYGISAIIIIHVCGACVGTILRKWHWSWLTAISLAIDITMCMHCMVHAIWLCSPVTLIVHCVLSSELHCVGAFTQSWAGQVWISVTNGCILSLFFWSS